MATQIGTYKIQTSGGILAVPIYRFNTGIAYQAVRVMNNAGEMGCLEVVDVGASNATPLRIQTPYGVRAIAKALAYTRSYKWDAAALYAYTASGTTKVLNGNYVSFTSTHGDPICQMYPIGPFATNLYRYIEVKYRLNPTASYTGASTALFFTSSASDYWSDGTRQISTYLQADSQWRTFTYDMYTNSKWLSEGSVARFRFDYINDYYPMTMDVEYMMIYG